MVFSSAIFLFVFLPIVCALYFIVPGIKGKNTLLIIASLIFYAFGEPIYVLLMIGSIIANYIFGLMEGRFSKANNIAGKKIVLIIAVICNIGVLCVFKYTAFILENINYAGRLNIKIPGIALPIGISFFTFQALSYVIDVYRNPEMVQKNLFNLMLYVSFFPQLIAGPIIRYNEIAKQINNRTSSIEKTTEGISRFIRGLTKKLIIANATGYMADSIFALKIINYNFLVAWVGAIAYTLQIYYDFSGYSDMAIGMAKIFGFEFNENFNHPYSAKGIKDFWRRWHISLSLWFREYVYIPLGGNRKGKFRCEFNKMIVFLLTGIWHGANWTFVIWGLIHGVANVIEDTLGSIIKIKNNIIKNIITWIVVVCGFVMFRADSVGLGLTMLKTMFTGFNKVVSDMPKEYGKKQAIDYFLDWMDKNLILDSDTMENTDKLSNMTEVFEKNYFEGCTSCVVEGKAVATGYSKVLTRLCNKAGISAHMTIGSWKYSGSYTLVNVDFEGKQVYIDASGCKKDDLWNQRYISDTLMARNMTISDLFNDEK